MTQEGNECRGFILHVLFQEHQHEKWEVIKQLVTLKVS